MSERSPSRVCWVLLDSLLDYLPAIRTASGQVAAGGPTGPAPSRVVECVRCSGKGHSTPGRQCDVCEGRGRLTVDAYTGQPIPVEAAKPRALKLAEIDRQLDRLAGRAGRDWTEQRDLQWRRGSYASVWRELRRLLEDTDPLVGYAGWCVWTYVVCDQQVPLHDSTVRVIDRAVALIAARVVERDGEIRLPPWLDLDDEALEMQHRRFLWRGHGPAAERARRERDVGMRQMRAAGMDVGEIARRHGLSRSRVYEILAQPVPTVAA